MKIKLLAAVVASLLAPSCALASTMIESHTIAAAPVSFTDSFTLPAFNTALGTLTGVTLELSSNLTVDFEVINGTGFFHVGFNDATASVPLSITGPASLNLSDMVSIAPFSGVAVQGVTEFPGLTGSSSASYAVPTADFSAYESATPLELNFVADAGDATYSAGPVPPLVGFRGSTQGGSTNVGGVFSVIYSYASDAAAVPEPATWAMLVIGFGGLGAVVRRRSRMALAA